MNDIKELVEIIEDNGGSATLDTICTLYAEKNKVYISNNHRQVIRETLNSNPDLVKKVDYKGNEIYKLNEDKFITFLRKLKNKCAESKGDGNWCKQHCPLNLDGEDYCGVMVFAAHMRDEIPADYDINKFKDIINGLNLKKGE